METIDDRLNDFIAFFELNDEVCHLKHGPSSDDSKNYPAVDYLCQNLGFFGLADTQIRIPICAECHQALQSREWILFYCVTCNKSQWLLRSKAKRHYDENVSIMWLKNCPNCYTESDYIKK